MRWTDGQYQTSSVQGVACTPSSGDRVNFTLVVGNHSFDNPSAISFYTAGVRLPDLSAHVFRRFDNGDGMGFSGTAYVCKSSLFL